jgi:iron complex outermembrane receptor protein
MLIGILKNTSFERTTTSLSLNPVLFDNHLKLILMEIYHLENRFQDEGAVIGSAIGFDPHNQFTMQILVTEDTSNG